MEFDYPDAEAEAEIVAKEGVTDLEMSKELVKIGQKVLRGHGLEEGVSTRLLIYAAQMIAKGITPSTQRKWQSSHRSPTTANCSEVFVKL